MQNQIGMKYTDRGLVEKYPLGVTPCSDGSYVINSGDHLIVTDKEGVALFNRAVEEQAYMIRFHRITKD